MNIRKLTSGLSYVGEATGKRRTYHVFRGERHYVVMSLSASKRNAGNFNVVDADGVGRAASRFAGRKGVTAKMVAAAARRPGDPATPLEALNVLYVLVAEQRARVDTRFKEKQLFFNVAG